MAVVCSVPLLAEAVRAALGFAEVAEFPEHGGDVSGLVRWMRPDVLVVDSDEVAAAVTDYAREHDLPVLHIELGADSIRLFSGGAWEHVGSGEGATPEAVRNVVAGALYAREGARR